MAYHTNLYLLLFLPAAVLIYSLVPVKARRILLLLANLIFYVTASHYLVVFLLGTALLTYLLGLRMGAIHAGADPSDRTALQAAQDGSRKYVTLGILCLIGVLLWLKYTNFFLANINRLGGALFGMEPIPLGRLLVPLGISFYTLEAIGYLLDVHWKRIPAETSFFRLLLFLSFFPTIMEGPICRYSDVADSLWSCRRASMEEVETAVLRILWGLFKKLLIADRLNTVVGTVYGSYADYSGYVVAGTAVLYTLQLYLEFSGAIDMVIGSGMLFGVKLPENFRQPFFARSASEFWRRWHISLGVWFKNYIFYPVTLSDRVKKWSRKARRQHGPWLAKLGTSFAALLPVWLCNGLWHGPQWNYIFYGVYYLFFLTLEVALEPVAKKIRELSFFTKHPVPLEILQVLKTWLIIFVGELFFRAEGLVEGAKMFLSIFRPYVSDPGKTIIWRRLGINRSDWAVIFFGLAVVIMVDCVLEWMQRTGRVFRFSGVRSRIAYCYVLFFLVLLLGAYGAGYLAVDLIYAGF